MVNAGSATHKYSLFEGSKKRFSIVYEKGLKKSLKNFLKNQEVRDILQDREIVAMAFRIVHGGSLFIKPTLVSRSVLKKLKSLDHLAPLHNPHARKLVVQSEKILPKARKLLIFDTAFHATLPEVNWRYAIPKKMADKNHLRRYGFHGIVCSSIVRQLKEKKKLKKRLIICHLGSGCSVTAVLNGQSIDTSMGFTPLEGLVMGTRAGDIDPGLLLHLEQSLKMKSRKLFHLLNFESGLKGLAGTNDMREILKKEKKSKDARLALEIFCQKAAKVIAAQIVSLGGIDQLVFSGGIGENSAVVRKKIKAYLKPLTLRASLGSFKSSSVNIPTVSSDESSEMNRLLLALKG